MRLAETSTVSPERTNHRRMTGSGTFRCVRDFDLEARSLAERRRREAMHWNSQ